MLTRAAKDVVCEAQLVCQIQKRCFHFCLPVVTMVKQLALFKAALTGLGLSSNTYCHLANVMTAYL